MRVPFQYFNSNTRLAASVAFCSQEQGFRFFCLEGVISKNRDEFTVTTPTVTVLVCWISKDDRRNLSAVMSTSPDLKVYDRQVIDTDVLKSNNIYYNLCTLLKQKYSNTRNPFTIDFSGADGTVSVSAQQSEDSDDIFLSLCTKGTAGEVITTGDAWAKRILNTCKDIKRFEYVASTPEVEKSVMVRKSRGEIFREIAHYLNKTVVLVSFPLEGGILEQYISATGVLEVTTKNDGTRFYKKISPITLRSSTPFCIYLTAASVDDISREQGRCLKKQQ